MKKELILLCFGLFIAVSSLDVDDTAINQTVSEEVKEVCDYYEEDYTQEEIDDAQIIIDGYEKYLENEDIDAYIGSDFSKIYD